MIIGGSGEEKVTWWVGWCVKKGKGPEEVKKPRSQEVNLEAISP
jgi:hypothetical protein